MSADTEDTRQHVLVLSGPNLGRLGRRQPEVYGRLSYADLVERLVQRGEALGLAVDARQTDAEAEMIGWLHAAADREVPVVINPGALTHYNLAIADAVAQCTNVVVEVHLSNVHGREEFRRHSVVSPYVTGVIAGLGADGYELALALVAMRSGRAPEQVRPLHPRMQAVDHADGSQD